VSETCGGQLAPELRLDEVDHRAFLGGRELVRVTTALSDVGLADTRWFTPESCARGTRVHAASAAYFTAHKEPKPHAAYKRIARRLEATDLPYFDGLRRFARETGFLCTSK